MSSVLYPSCHVDRILKLRKWSGWLVCELSVVGDVALNVAHAKLLGPDTVYPVVICMAGLCHTC